MEAALNRRPPNREDQLNAGRGAGDPAGRARLQRATRASPLELAALLADKLVELEVVEGISYQDGKKDPEKRPQAAPEPEAVVDPARGECRVRAGHGGRGGDLHAALRPALPTGLYGRDLKATA